MRFIDVLRLATRNFRTNRLRTFLTILAVSIATAAILFLVSFGYGLQLLTVSQIANSATVATIDVLPFSTKSLIKLDKIAVERIKQIDNVVSVGPDLDLEAEAHLESIGTIVVHAVTPKYFELADIRPVTGKLYADSDTHKVIVSSGFLSQFNLPKGDSVLGKTFTLTYTVSDPDQVLTKTKQVEDAVPYSVVGVVEDVDTAYAYVPLDDALKLIDSVPFANLKVQATNKDKVLDVKDAINTLGYDASAPLDTLKQLDRIFAIAQIVLGALGVIALIISSIGMFNTMTISLLERTKEIGIMKAIGASKSDIWKLFLAESTIIGLCGGVAGVLLGTGLAFLANTILNFLAGIYGGQQATIFYSPPWFMLAIILFSTFVGLITGFYPARRAAILNPLKALRYE